MQSTLSIPVSRRIWFAVVGILLLLLAGPAGAAQDTPDIPFPRSVTIAGTIQSVLGCPNDWAPECEETFLGYNADSDLWIGSWVLPAGSYEYKAALNSAWTDNFGLNAEYYGPNIPLELAEETRVTFYYSHDTGWITDDVNSIIANVPGSFQDEIGCPGEWAPDCLRSWLQDPDGDGVYTYVTTYIPAGDYEAKVAVDLSWDVNYGADGAAGGDNIAFSVPENAEVTFSWDTSNNVMTVTTADAPEGAATAPPVRDVAASQQPVNPDFVTIPGTIQSALGCPGDWAPDCDVTFLTLDEEDDIWQATFTIPAGDYEYKVAINQSWSENYGQGAQRDGPNISLSLAEETDVTFLYDHKTNWVADSVNYPIITVVGDFQTELGCAANDDPGCLQTWLQDPDGNGSWEVSTRPLPAGTYTALVAFGQALDEVYGADGAVGGAPIEFTVAADGTEVFFAFNLETKALTINTEGAPKGDLGKAQAHWVARDTIAWNLDTEGVAGYRLYYAYEGGLAIAGETLGGDVLELTVDPAGLDGEILARFPHLAGFTALKIGADDLGKVRIALKGQVAVAAVSDSGRLSDATSLQIAGVLDDIYTYDGALGVTWDGDTPSLHVWAPTAQRVRLFRYADASPEADAEVQVMRVDPDSGVWSLEGAPEWNYQYYLYEVQVYVPSTGQVETNLVTDPYSISLSINSGRSQIVDLNDPTLMPDGWADTAKPPLAAPEDIVLYELHVRDFSARDESVPEALRGTFAAFTVADSNGMQHLRALAEAGLTHIHLLPVFDIATIDEDKSNWVNPDYAALAALAPDSDEQQALLDYRADGFNWGYDPYHYSTPEGSYSTDPNSPQRILEFRQMVQALNADGLRVVMDVVYNHTNASGQSERSVLDRVVPGYYHRLDNNGRVANSTCCANTATEHNMMRKLMVDSVVMWATAYKVDGFRFDLMGHHMVGDMQAVRDALDALAPDGDGVNGAEVYVYGEGWNFGEVADNARGVNATQLNVGGMGIGTFNDRIRDAVRGGNPFGGYQEQGFITGLYYDPNTVDERGESEQRLTLLTFMDQIRVALAGNLADYAFTNFGGETVTGADVDYNGSPAGYTQDPQEHIIYISAHDNETLFDAIVAKVPEDTTLAEIVRMQNMGLSLVSLSQGVPFFHAGVDLLRSKSFDRDSYDSGDWFNFLDFTYQSNNFGVGLPPSDKNQENYAIMGPLLAREDWRPGPAEIEAANAHFREMLQIRASSALFRLQTADAVQNRVVFHNTGADQVPGLIVMSISDVDQAEDLDPDHDYVVVIFNATTDGMTFTTDALSGMPFTLHPVQANSADAVVQNASFADGTFSVPPRTTAVFVTAQGAATAAAAEDAGTEVTTAAPAGDEATAGDHEAEGDHEDAGAAGEHAAAAHDSTAAFAGAIAAGVVVLLIGGAAVLGHFAPAGAGHHEEDHH